MGRALIAFILAATLVLLLTRELSGGMATDGGTDTPSPMDPPQPENSYRPGTLCWTVYDACRAAGFAADTARMMTAIAQAESGCSPAATCRDCGGVREFSVGAFQLNLLAHPQISEAAARDVYTAARWAYQISGGGANFRPWAMYTNGRYREYLA